MVPEDSFRRHVVAERKCQTNLQTLVIAGQRWQRVRHTQARHSRAIERLRAGRVCNDKLRNTAIAIDRELHNRAAAPGSHAYAFGNYSTPIRSHYGQDTGQVRFCGAAGGGGEGGASLNATLGGSGMIWGGAVFAMGCWAICFGTSKRLVLGRGAGLADCEAREAMRSARSICFAGFCRLGAF